MDRASGSREWIAKRLRYQIEIHEKSVAQVEKEMGLSRGYLGDALRGEKRLSLELLLEVLDHLEVEFGQFFSGTTPAEERWGKYPRPSSAGELSPGIAEAATTRGTPGRDDTRSLIIAVIQVLEDKGILDQDDLLAALAEKKS